MVGAGALGGYFGGRLLEAGRDVTFLVRARRAAELARTGLVVHSPFGGLTLTAPPHVLAQDIAGPFDVVIVGCKAYDLEQTMESFAPAVGRDTAILPLLNGTRHLDQLDARFGHDRVLGGLCMISATLDGQGAVAHLNDLHALVLGERDGSRSARVAAIGVAFAGANFESRISDEILQEMWEKWVFIASAAGITCLMRASIGDIVAAGGGPVVHSLLDQCANIAARNGHAPRPQWLERARLALTAPKSPITASMFKDMERGAAIEADHIVGDLLRRGGTEAAAAPSVLAIAYAHLRAYEARRAGQARA